MHRNHRSTSNPHSSSQAIPVPFAQNRYLLCRRLWDDRLAGIVLSNSLAHIYFTNAPRQTLNLVFLVIGVGCVFLSVRGLVMMLIAVFAGWWYTVWLLVRPGTMTAYFDFDLCSVAVLAILIFTLRLRTYSHLEAWRWRDAQRTGELEAALSSAEGEILKRRETTPGVDAGRKRRRSRRYFLGFLARGDEISTTQCSPGTGTQTARGQRDDPARRTR
jgi:hypothetical protein